MADAMLKMMSDADLRNKYANRAKQRSNEFAQSNMWGKWEKVING